jgi:hypothetical protein
LCQGLLSIGIADQAFLNAKPRIGLLSNLQNDGATAGTFISGELIWDSTPLKLVMTSPQLETWSYSTKGQMNGTGPTTFTFVAPVRIQSHGSAAVTLWFTRTENLADRLFTYGDHTLEVRLYDGIQNAPVVRRDFKTRLETKQVSDIYSSGNETAEFTVPLSFHE